MIRHEIAPDGTECWIKNNNYYRRNGPAWIWPNGSERWEKNNELHRVDGPAKISPRGAEEWYENGSFCGRIQFLIVLP